MSGVNKAILIGRLGRDAELRFTQTGQPVSSLSLATDDQWTDKDGNKQKRTEWHRVSIWGKTAENLNKYLVKGKQIYVEGRLQTREWEDKDGVKRYTTEVVALTVQLLGDAPNGTRPPHPADAEAVTGPEPVSIPDEDVPF